MLLILFEVSMPTYTLVLKKKKNKDDKIEKKKTEFESDFDP